ncbi:p115 like vesicle tethering protein, partial [Yarrowia lipolytica]
MNALSGFIRDSQPKTQSADHAIPTLCDRLTHATLLEDRRSAVLALKGLSKEYREAVAAGGMRGLISALTKDNDDDETVRASLETLLILFLGNDSDDRSTRGSLTRRGLKYISPLLRDTSSIDFIALWLTDEFSQNNENFATLIGLLSSHDTYIRLYTLKLLAAVVQNRSERVQECILEVPDGLMNLVAGLDDPTEFVRSECIIVLSSLVLGNADVQKLVVFENAFHRLFSIMDDEGGLQGGYVVGDCLTLLTHLLRYNVSNQVAFRETSCVSRLAQLLELPPDMEWNEQTTRNCTLALETCSLFVPEHGSVTRANQDAFLKAGVLFSILRLAFGANSSTPIRSFALITSGNLLRGNHAIQADFAAVDVPYVDVSQPPAVRVPVVMPVILALLKWTLSTQSVHFFDLRVGAAYCLQAYFQGNHHAKLEFIKQQIDAYNRRNKSEDTKEEKETAHHESDYSQYDSVSDNIIEALVNYDPDMKLNPYRPWFAAVLLLHIIIDCHEAQVELQNVVVGDEDIGEDPVSFIQAIAGVMVTCLPLQEPRIVFGYAMLLITILYENVGAVSDFLGESSTVEALLAVVSRSQCTPLMESMCCLILGTCYEFSDVDSAMSRADLYSLLRGSLGADQYLLKTKRLKDSSYFKDFDSEDILNAEKDDVAGLPKVYFDEIFVELVKENFTRLSRALLKDPSHSAGGKISYELVQSLEDNVKSLTDELEEVSTALSETKSATSAEIKDLKAIRDDLERDLQETDTRLKEARGALESLEGKFHTKVAAEKQLQTSLEAERKSGSGLQTELADLKKKLQTLTQQKTQLTTQVETLTAAKDKAESGINKMSKELFQLTRERDGSDKEKKGLQKELAELKKQDSSRRTELTALAANLKQTIKRLKEELSERTAELDKLKSDLASSEKDLASKTKDVSAKDTEIEKLKSELETANSKLASTAKEVEILTSELKAAKSDACDSETKIKAVESELVEQKSKVEHLNAELAAKSSSVESGAAELAEKVALVESLTAKLESKDKELATKTEELSAKEKELETKTSELETKTAELTTKSKELTAKSDEATTYSAKVKELETSSAALEKKQTTLKAMADNLTKDLAEKTKELVAAKSELESSNTSSKEEVDVLTKKLSDATAEAVELKKSSQAAETEASSKAENFEHDISSLKDDLAQAEKERDALRTELDTSIKEMENERTSLTKDADSATKELTNKVSMLQTKLDELTASHKKALGDSETEAKGLKKEIKAAQAEIKTLEEVKAKYEASQTDIKGLEKQVSELTESLETKTSETEAVKTALEEKLEEASSAKSKLETKVTELEKEVADNQGKHGKAASELEASLETQLADAKKELDNVKSTHADGSKKQASELNELKTKLEEVATANTKLETELKNASAKLEEEQAAKTKLSSDLEAKTKEVASLKMEIKSLRDEQTSNASSAGEFKGKIEKLEVELKTKETELQTKASNLESASSALEAASKELKSKATELESASSELKSKTSELESKTTELKTINTELKDRTSELKTKTTELESKSTELKTVSDTQSATEKALAELQSKYDELLKTNKAKSAATKDMVPKSEYEELMLMITDLDEKVEKYKEKLEEHGVE